MRLAITVPWRRPPARRWRRWLSHAFWYGVPAIVVALVLGYFGLALVWHVQRPVVPVMGHSMVPKLRAGDLVLIKGVDPHTLEKGDIIAFRTTKDMQGKYGVPGSYVHRIVKIQHDRKYGLEFRTRGDNVSGPDPFWTNETDVLGRYAGRLPRAGYPILFLRSRQGMIFLGAAAAILLVYFLLGLWEKRQLQEEDNQFTLRTIVEEARTLTDRMADATSPRGPPAPSGGAVVESEQAAGETLPGGHAAATAGVDFDRLEQEIHGAVTASADIRATMKELVAAVGEYGEHLRSHTAVMQGLAATTDDLRSATVEMRDVLRESFTAEPLRRPVTAAAPDERLEVALVLESTAAAIVNWQLEHAAAALPELEPLQRVAAETATDLLALATRDSATFEEAEAAARRAAAELSGLGIETPPQSKLHAILFGAVTFLSARRRAR